MRRKANLVAILAIAAFGAGLTGTAAAQAIPPTTSGDTGASAETSASASAGTSSGDEFTKLDKDKDGMVSKKEGKKSKDLAGRWDTLDANKDGKLDQAEFAQFETAPTGSADSMSGSSSSTDTTTKP